MNNAYSILGETRRISLPVTVIRVNDWYTHQNFDFLPLRRLCEGVNTITSLEEPGAALEKHKNFKLDFWPNGAPEVELDQFW